ncbi:MAG: hypothetical protein PVJ57_03395 [Phycisphaerae bacterium]
MDGWRESFLDKLNRAQMHWVRQFEEALDKHFVPVFTEFKSFLVDNGFRLSMPLNEQGRRSFKFELAENAYLLLIFRSAGVGEFELRSESFVPGCEPVLSKVVARVADLERTWVTERLQAALGGFVDSLAGVEPPTVPDPIEDVVTV